MPKRGCKGWAITRHPFLTSWLSLAYLTDPTLSPAPIPGGGESEPTPFSA